MKEISNEDLVKAAMAPVDQDLLVIEKLNDAQKFILANDIKRGTDLVSATNVYDTYRKWRKGKCVPKRHFFVLFARYFERKRLNHGMFYLLDDTPFDQSMDKYWELRAQVRAEHEKTRKKNEVKLKNAEKSTRVSGTGQKIQS